LRKRLEKGAGEKGWRKRLRKIRAFISYNLTILK
jgi:hypothetical protein